MLKIFISKIVVLLCIQFSNVWSDALTCIDTSTVQTVLEKITLGKRMMRFCEPKNELYFELEDAVTIDSITVKACPWSKGKKELLINGQTIDLKCAYIETDSVFTNFLYLYPNKNENKFRYIQAFDTLGNSLEFKRKQYFKFNWKRMYLPKNQFSDSSVPEVFSYTSLGPKEKKVKLILESRRLYDLENGLLKLEKLQKALFFDSKDYSHGNLKYLEKECKKSDLWAPFLPCSRECVYIAVYNLERPLKDFGTMVLDSQDVKQFENVKSFEPIMPPNVLNWIEPIQWIRESDYNKNFGEKKVQSYWRQEGNLILISDNSDFDRAKGFVKEFSTKHPQFKFERYGDFLQLMLYTPKYGVGYLFYKGKLVFKQSPSDSRPGFLPLSIYKSASSTTIVFGEVGNDRGLFLLNLENGVWQLFYNSEVFTSCGP